MTFKRLIIGEIPHDFNVNEDLIFSDLCFNKIEDLLNFKSELKIPETTENKDSKIQYIINLANNFSLKFAEKYNLNYKEYSANFWKTIYVPYLYVVLTILSFYEETILNIISKNAFKLKVKITNAQPLFFKSEDDFFLNFNSQLQELIVSEMIRIKYLDCFDIEYFESNYKVKNIQHEKSLNKIARIADNLFSRAPRGYGINFLHKIILHFFLSFTKSKNANRNESHYKINIDNSNMFFNVLIDKLIPYDLKNLDLLIKDFSSKFFSKDKIRLVSNKIYWNTNYKLHVALSEEAGEIIIPAQHGGHRYGSCSGESLSNHIEYSRRFITWGWSKTDSDRYNMIPLPSPLLSKFMNAYKKKTNYIIVVSTFVPKVPLFFEESLAVSIQKNEYITSKISLISQFNNFKVFNKIRYRPYSTSNNHFNDTSYLKQFFPQLKVLNSDLHSEILKCELLILDHPGTTWNIAMAANIPLFLFFKINHWNLTKEAKLYLESFKKLGIYHETSESLIEQYILINKTGIYEWWNSGEIQALRHKWNSKYAKAERLWFFTWMRQFKKI